MDDLLIANEAKAEHVMRTFPKEVRSPDRQDFDDLAALYKAKEKQIAIYDTAAKPLNYQLDLLDRHVSTCYKIWPLVRANMTWKDHSIRDLYTMGMEGRKIAGGSRRDANQSPTKNRVVQLDTLATNANKRELARIWHEGLSLEDVTGLCVDDNELRRLLISCAATKANFKPRQIFPYVSPQSRSLADDASFFMDFPTTLQLKAERVGKAMTITSDAMMAKKPTWRAEKG